MSFIYDQLVQPDGIPIWTQWAMGLGYNTVNPITVPSKDLTGKYALITGGNMGIGFETASFLLSMNVSKVTICVRTEHPGEPKPSEVVERLCRDTGRSRDRIEIWELDCSSFESVRGLAKRWDETGRGLDLLFCNAGVCTSARMKTKTDGIELHRQINYLSHFLLTLLLLPSLKKAKAPRVVFTSSCFHWLGDPIRWDDLDQDKMSLARWNAAGFLYAYGRSKLCLAMFSKELQERLDSNEDTKHIRTFAVHPGNVATAIFSRFYTWWNWPMNALIYSATVLGISAREGARALIVAAVSDEDERAIRGGRFWNRAWEQVPRREVHDPAVRKKLWEKSASECGIQSSPL